MHKLEFEHHKELHINVKMTVGRIWYDCKAVLNYPHPVSQSVVQVTLEFRAPEDVDMPHPSNARHADPYGAEPHALDEGFLEEEEEEEDYGEHYEDIME